ncbi:DUF4488 domain-containing protein [Sphingobacterium sp. LRF_L2]|uniref:DUF4488 domain-containing protein n=1 Tax=Sphingobacterium sp. LRF_L2 TaxID=3369421 RepID=UPI003F5EA947
MIRIYSTLLFITVALFFCSSNIATLPSKKNKDRFIGIWELVAVENATGEEFPILPGQLKIFAKDRTYRFLSIGSQGTSIRQEGTFKVHSDTLYSEEIEFATNPILLNLSSKISYVFRTEDTLFITGEVNGAVFREKWARVKMPSR